MAQQWEDVAAMPPAEQARCIQRLPSNLLEQLQDWAERKGNSGLADECETELDRRDYDAADPAIVPREDTPALAPGWWEYR